MRRYKCSICGYVYDESAGITEKKLTPGTKWEDIPDGFKCPICAAPKPSFKPHEEIGPKIVPTFEDNNTPTPSVKELSAGEISAICSSLALGCEKQRLMLEMDAFNKLADYFRNKIIPENGKTLYDITKMLDDDLSDGFATAISAAKATADRGALRSLVWSEKVSMMLKTLLDRFAQESDVLLENAKLFVCDICGFIYIGGAPPEICPVCKVPYYKILECI